MTASWTFCAAQRLTHHLHECGRCEAELREMRRLSQLLADLRPGRGIAPLQRARLHKTLNEQSAEPVLRLTKFIAAAAASILIIAGAWLVEMPKTTNRGAVSLGPAAPEWERVAVSLEVDPPPDVAPDTRFAEAHFADWMMDRLNGMQP